MSVQDCIRRRILDRISKPPIIPYVITDPSILVPPDKDTRQPITDFMRNNNHISNPYAYRLFATPPQKLVVYHHAVANVYFWIDHSNKHWYYSVGDTTPKTHIEFFASVPGMSHFPYNTHFVPLYSRPTSHKTCKIESNEWSVCSSHTVAIRGTDYLICVLIPTSSADPNNIRIEFILATNVKETTTQIPPYAPPIHGLLVQTADRIHPLVINSPTSASGATPVQTAPKHDATIGTYSGSCLSNTIFTSVPYDITNLSAVTIDKSSIHHDVILINTYTTASQLGLFAYPSDETEGVFCFFYGELRHYTAELTPARVFRHHVHNIQGYKTITINNNDPPFAIRVHPASSEQPGQIQIPITNITFYYLQLQPLHLREKRNAPFIRTRIPVVATKHRIRKEPALPYFMHPTQTITAKTRFGTSVFIHAYSTDNDQAICLTSIPSYSECTSVPSYAKDNLDTRIVVDVPFITLSATRPPVYDYEVGFTETKSNHYVSYAEYRIEHALSLAVRLSPNPWLTPSDILHHYTEFTLAETALEFSECNTETTDQIFITQSATSINISPARYNMYRFAHKATTRHIPECSVTLSLVSPDNKTVKFGDHSCKIARKPFNPDHSHYAYYTSSDDMSNFTVYLHDEIYIEGTTLSPKHTARADYNVLYDKTSSTMAVFPSSLPDTGDKVISFAELRRNKLGHMKAHVIIPYTTSTANSCALNLLNAHVKSTIYTTSGGFVSTVRGKIDTFSPISTSVILPLEHSPFTLSLNANVPGTMAGVLRTNGKDPVICGTQKFHRVNANGTTSTVTADEMKAVKYTGLITFILTYSEYLVTPMLESFRNAATAPSAAQVHAAFLCHALTGEKAALASTHPPPVTKARFTFFDGSAAPSPKCTRRGTSQCTRLVTYADKYAANIQPTYTCKAHTVALTHFAEYTVSHTQCAINNSTCKYFNATKTTIYTPQNRHLCPAHFMTEYKGLYMSTCIAGLVLDASSSCSGDVSAFTRLCHNHSKTYTQPFNTLIKDNCSYVGCQYPTTPAALASMPNAYAHTHLRDAIVCDSAPPSTHPSYCSRHWWLVCMLSANRPRTTCIYCQERVTHVGQSTCNTHHTVAAAAAKMFKSPPMPISNVPPTTKSTVSAQVCAWHKESMFSIHCTHSTCSLKHLNRNTERTCATCHDTINVNTTTCVKRPCFNRLKQPHMAFCASVYKLSSSQANTIFTFYTPTGYCNIACIMKQCKPQPNPPSHTSYDYTHQTAIDGTIYPVPLCTKHHTAWTSEDQSTLEFPDNPILNRTGVEAGHAHDPSADNMFACMNSNTLYRRYINCMEQSTTGGDCCVVDNACIAHSSRHDDDRLKDYPRDGRSSHPSFAPARVCPSTVPLQCSTGHTTGALCETHRQAKTAPTVYRVVNTPAPAPAPAPAPVPSNTSISAAKTPAVSTRQQSTTANPLRADNKCDIDDTSCNHYTNTAYIYTMPDHTHYCLSHAAIYYRSHPDVVAQCYAITGDARCANKPSTSAGDIMCCNEHSTLNIARHLIDKGFTFENVLKLTGQNLLPSIPPIVPARTHTVINGCATDETTSCGSYTDNIDILYEQDDGTNLCFYHACKAHITNPVAHDKCYAVTTSNTQCKKSPLAGGVFCATRHPTRDKILTALHFTPDDVRKLHGVAQTAAAAPAAGTDDADDTDDTDDEEQPVNPSPQPAAAPAAGTDDAESKKASDANVVHISHPSTTGKCAATNSPHGHLEGMPDNRYTRNGKLYCWWHFVRASMKKTKKIDGDTFDVCLWNTPTQCDQIPKTSRFTPFCAKHEKAGGKFANYTYDVHAGRADDSTPTNAVANTIFENPTK